MKLSYERLAVPLACALSLACSGASAQDVSTTSPSAAHDLDFSLGLWTVAIKRTPDPFDDPLTSSQLKGTVSVKPLWGGKAHIEEMEVDGPVGHWEGLNLFLYNPAGQQWSKLYASSRTGQTEPPLIGNFHDGVGEFYSPDTLKGRSIFTRARWSNITAKSYDYDEAYSKDGGKTWRLSFEAHLTKVS